MFSTIVIIIVFIMSVSTGLTEKDRSTETTEKKLEHSEQQNTSMCHPWFIYDNRTGQCVCGDDLNGVISCDTEDHKVYIIECYCMTYDDQLGITVGSCFTNCIQRKSDLSFHMYLKIPAHVNTLNEAMCGKYWNRNGRLCGKCKDSFYPLAYSYDMKCTNSTLEDRYNWIKYISSAFLPLTVFFFITLVFGISASSPKLEAFVIFAQIITTPANVRMILEALDSGKYPVAQTICHLIAACYGIWNLDFFRTILPPNSLKLSTLQILALDYVIAVYPLVLIVFTYIVIDLYDRHFLLLTWMIKPFKQFSCFKKAKNATANIKSSILNTFVTFVLLSYGKFLTVSFDMLVFTKVYAPNGKGVSNVLFYDASIEYFGREHLPYGILAIIVTIFFNILPLLFTLIHPLRCFKQHIGRWPALHICLDSFQGCYKDGTSGTRDCRFFSSLFLLIRIALFIAYGCIKGAYYYPFASILLLALVFLIILFQPFKPQFRIYNTIYASIILTLAVWNVTVVCINIAALKALYIVNFFVILSTITSILPLLYVTFLFFKWFLSQKPVQYFRTKYYINCRLRRSTTGEDDQEPCLNDSFPHRLEHVINEEQSFPNYSMNVNATLYGSIQQKADSTN